MKLKRWSRGIVVRKRSAHVHIYCICHHVSDMLNMSLQRLHYALYRVSSLKRCMPRQPSHACRERHRHATPEHAMPCHAMPCKNTPSTSVSTPYSIPQAQARPNAYSYALTTNFIPVLQSLAATNNAVPAVVNAAPKIQIPVKLFSFPRMAPAMGVPAKTPKLMHAKPMPIRVPIKARFCVRETKMEGGRDTNVPEKKPSERI